MLKYPKIKMLLLTHSYFITYLHTLLLLEKKIVWSKLSGFQTFIHIIQNIQLLYYINMKNKKATVQHSEFIVNNIFIFS